MLLLAFDTSTPQVTVALAGLPALSTGSDPGVVTHEQPIRVVAAHELEAPNRHGELLAPLIEQTLADAGATRGELTAVAVGLGPGPFTGLRVGIVTAAALSDALGVPAYGVASLDAIAAAHRADPSDGRDLLVVTDARRRQVYWSLYSNRGVRTAGPDVEPPAELAARFTPDRVRVAGAGARLYQEAFAGFEVDESRPFPQARAIAAMAADRAGRSAPADVLEPLYLRRPDARPPGTPKAVTP